MKIAVKRSYRIRIALFFIVGVLINKCYCQESVLLQKIEAEFKILRDLAMEPQTKLQIDQTPDMTSEANTVKGILVFNVPQLQALTREIGMAYQDDMIRLIISHELGHQVQYHYLSTQGGLLYECQADIIAGYLLYRKMMMEGGEWLKKNNIHDATDLAYQKKLSEWDDRFHAALTAIFMEGSNHVLTPSHPTNEERRLALRDGYNYGNVWTNGEFLENDPVLSASKLAPGMRERCRKYKALLGYFPNDDLMSWSSRHARKIIHSYLPNCRDIVVYTSWNVDSSDINFKINYLQQITNTGKKIITFSFYDQVYDARRTDPKNTLYWELKATEAHSVTLRPNETSSVSGTLEWLTLNQFTPVFTYPGKEGALYSATTLSDNTDPNGEIARSYFSGNDKSQSDENILGAYLNLRDLLSTFIGSVGVTYEQAFTNQVSYLSRLPIAAALSTNILFNRTTSQYDLEALYYHGDQKTKALQTVGEILQLLGKLKYNLKEETQGSGNERKWELQDVRHKAIGKITISYSPSFMEYETRLVIFGSK